MRCRLLGSTTPPGQRLPYTSSHRNFSKEAADVADVAIALELWTLEANHFWTVN